MESAHAEREGHFGWHPQPGAQQLHPGVQPHSPATPRAPAPTDTVHSLPGGQEDSTVAWSPPCSQDPDCPLPKVSAGGEVLKLISSGQSLGNLICSRRESNVSFGSLQRLVYTLLNVQNRKEKSG